MMAKSKTYKLEGTGFNPEAFKGMSREDFINLGLKNKTFAKRFPEEAQQRELLGQAYDGMKLAPSTEEPQQEQPEAPARQGRNK